KARRPETPVVLVTGWSDQINAAEALWLGVDVLLAKPFGVEEIRSVLGQTLAPAPPPTAGPPPRPARPRPPAVSLQPPLPQVLRLAQPLGHPPREDEEQVAEPVDVAERPLGERLAPREAQDLSLGAPAHGPGLVEERPHPAAARQHERLE